MIDLADACYFRVVVKNFGRKEVDLTREHQTNNDGSHPELLPIFARPPHSKVPFVDLGLIRLISSTVVRPYQITFRL